MVGQIRDGNTLKPTETIGESVKIELGLHGGHDIVLVISEKERGKTIPLIMWEKLPIEARCPHNEAKRVNFEGKMPRGDERFEGLLTEARPFELKN